METGVTRLKRIPRERVVAFLLSGSVLIGVPNVLQELCEVSVFKLLNFLLIFLGWVRVVVLRRLITS